jgi:transcriptional regulator with XRE-family HTH domain
MEARAIRQVVADNVFGLRGFKRLSQAEVARAMTDLGFAWTKSTTSEVENGKRALQVDELMALAVVFGVAPTDVLDPMAGGHRDPITFGANPVAAQMGRAWVRGRAILSFRRVGEVGHWRIRFEQAPAQDEPSYLSGAVAQSRLGDEHHDIDMEGGDD